MAIVLKVWKEPRRTIGGHSASWVRKDLTCFKLYWVKSGRITTRKKYWNIRPLVEFNEQIQGHLASLRILQDKLREGVVARDRLAKEGLIEV